MALLTSTARRSKPSWTSRPKPDRSSATSCAGPANTGPFRLPNKHDPLRCCGDCGGCGKRRPEPGPRTPAGVAEVSGGGEGAVKYRTILADPPWPIKDTGARTVSDKGFWKGRLDGASKVPY